jgi:hypothetical protein
MARNHLCRDLHPYICTHEKCETADRLYERYSEWIQHELVEHNSRTQCVLCPLSSWATGEPHHTGQHLVELALFALPPSLRNWREDEDAADEDGKDGDDDEEEEEENVDEDRKDADGRNSDATVDLGTDATGRIEAVDTPWADWDAQFAAQRADSDDWSLIRPGL